MQLVARSLCEARHELIRGRYGSIRRTSPLDGVVLKFEA
jgi:hypothetical protein